MLVATAVVTDGCLYSRGYVQKEGDIDDLIRYFWAPRGVTAAFARGPNHPTTAARVLSACLLPDRERDLVRVFGIGGAAMYINVHVLRFQII